LKFWAWRGGKLPYHGDVFSLVFMVVMARDGKNFPMC